MGSGDQVVLKLATRDVNLLERTWAVSARDERSIYSVEEVQRGQEDWRTMSSVVSICPLLRFVPSLAVLMCTERDDTREWQQWTWYFEIVVETDRTCDTS